MSVGKKLKNIRASMGLSQRNLADLCGCSSSFISQIELEQTSPSIESLSRICEGLGMRLTQFLSQEGEDQEALIVRNNAPRQFLSQWESATIEFLLPAREGSAFSALRLRIEPGGSTALRAARRHMLEIGYVVRGKATFRLSGKKHKLIAGDSVRFDLSTPHQWINSGDKELEVLLVNPNFTDVYEIELPISSKIQEKGVKGTSKIGDR